MILCFGPQHRRQRGMTAMLAVATGVWLGISPPAHAQATDAVQDVAQFYRGKQISLTVAGGVGGGYDTMARLMARHLGKHIPGHPTLFVQNNPAGGGLLLANALYNTAARDGTAIALPFRNIIMAPISRPQNARFDIARFNWIGNMGSETPVSFAWHTAKVRTIDDLLAHEIIIGVQTGADTELTPRFYNATIGSKFKPVSGYLGTAQILLAMERGEVEGIGDWSWSSFKIQKPDWLKEGKVRVLMQGGFKKHPELPDVPNAFDYAKSDLDRQAMEIYFAQKEIARPVLAPPDVPADRLAALRSGFMALAKDTEFLHDAERMRMELDLSPAASVERVVSIITAAPANVSARLIEAIGTP
jgi:tripartite-type tricarboxylate transporter receptor subunit TctC